MSGFEKKAERVRNKGSVNTALVSCPTPVLLDKAGNPYSPVRTNYFPHAQVLLGTLVEEEMKRAEIKGKVRVVDLKSLDSPEEWRSQLREYGNIKYGKTELTKFYVGNGFQRVELEGVDVVGITSNFTSEANSVAELIRLVGEQFPNAIIVVGGRDASARPRRYLEYGADTIALGDADASFPEFIKNLVGKGVSGELIERTKTKLPRIVPLLDFGLLKFLDRYTESGGGGFFKGTEKPPVAAYIETSRGCDRDCNFCTEALTTRKNFDLEAIMNAVLHYKGHRVRILLFSDDNLLEWLNRKNGEKELIMLFEFLREHEMIWEFSVGLEVGRLMDKAGKIREELMGAMFWNNGKPEKWAGAFRLLAPFENLGEEFTLYEKLRPWEDNLKIMGMLAEFGIPQVNLGVMFGWPTDNLNQVEGIRRKAGEIKRILSGEYKREVMPGLNLSLFCLMPLPGTGLYFQMEREGRIKYNINEDPELWNVFISVIEGKNFSAERITEIRRELIAEFNSEQPNGKVIPQWYIQNQLSNPDQ